MCCVRRLATNPLATGFPLMPKAIGIVVVAVSRERARRHRNAIWGTLRH